jgi:hypothetical protein
MADTVEFTASQEAALDMEVFGGGSQDFSPVCVTCLLSISDEQDRCEHGGKWYHKKECYGTKVWVDRLAARTAKPDEVAFFETFETHNSTLLELLTHDIMIVFKSATANIPSDGSESTTTRRGKAHREVALAMLRQVFQAMQVVLLCLCL